MKSGRGLPETPARCSANPSTQHASEREFRLPRQHFCRIRSLLKIEAVQHVVGRPVPVRQRLQPEVILDQSQGRRVPPASYG